MPKLLKHRDDTWVAEDAPPLTALQADGWQPGAALQLGADDEVLEAHAKAELILVDFPVFNDGRGLSQAVLLRTRFGFTGDLRATGDVHQDILHYMVRCGFTSFVLPDGRDADTALACLAPYSGHYQGSVTDPQPAYRRLSRA